MREGGVLSEERGEAEVEVGRGQLHLQSPQVGHRVERAGLKSECIFDENIVSENQSYLMTFKYEILESRWLLKSNVDLF